MKKLKKQVDEYTRIIFYLGKSSSYRDKSKVSKENRHEKKLLELLKKKIWNYIKGVFDRFSSRIDMIFHDYDLASHRGKVLDKEIPRKEVKKKLKRALRIAKNEIDRVIRTESWNILCEGYVSEMLRKGYDEDTKVFRRPRPDACPKCKKLFLDKNGIPKIFKLGELIANGSNVGRKEWLPVVDSVHPNCFIGDKVYILGKDFKPIRIDELEVGDYIISHLGYERRVVWLSRKLFSGSAYSVKFRGDKHGYIVTPDHMFPVLCKKTVKWKSVSEIKKDDQILCTDCSFTRLGNLRVFPVKNIVIRKTIVHSQPVTMFTVEKDNSYIVLRKGRSMRRNVPHLISHNCQCSPPQRIPEGFTFDRKGRLVLK